MQNEFNMLDCSICAGPRPWSTIASNINVRVKSSFNASKLTYKSTELTPTNNDFVTNVTNITVYDDPIEFCSCTAERPPSIFCFLTL